MLKHMLMALMALLFAGTATAADLAPIPVQPLAVATPYNWTGPYVGGYAGWAHTGVEVRDTNGGVNPGPFNYSANNVTAGALAGYRYQFDQYPVVLGAEVSLGYLGVNGKGTIGSANAAAHQNLTLDSGIYADIALQAGYSIDLGANGALLPYVTGGWAYFGGKAKQQTTNPGYAASDTGSFNGPMLGAGLDYALNANWVVGIEYKHVWLGKQSAGQRNVGDESSPPGYVFRNSHKPDIDIAMLRAAYRF